MPPPSPPSAAHRRSPPHWCRPSACCTPGAFASTGRPSSRPVTACAGPSCRRTRSSGSATGWTNRPGRRTARRRHGPPSRRSRGSGRPWRRATWRRSRRRWAVGTARRWVPLCRSSPTGGAASGCVRRWTRGRTGSAGSGCPRTPGRRRRAVGWPWCRPGLRTAGRRRSWTACARRASSSRCTRPGRTRSRTATGWRRPWRGPPGRAAAYCRCSLSTPGRIRRTRR